MQIQETTQQTAQAAAPAHPLLSPVFPRFTPQEALILNTVASAYPGHVTIDEILRKLRQVMAPSVQFSGPSRASLLVAAAMIRAKLGERKWQASRFVSVFSMTETGKRGRLIGYAWRG